MSGPISFAALKLTMPWREVTLPHGQVMVIDNTGHEVPIFTMTAFLTFITGRLASEVQPGQPAST